MIGLRGLPVPVALSVYRPMAKAPRLPTLRTTVARSPSIAPLFRRPANTYRRTVEPGPYRVGRLLTKHSDRSDASKPQIFMGPKPSASLGPLSSIIPAAKYVVPRPASRPPGSAHTDNGMIRSGSRVLPVPPVVSHGRDPVEVSVNNGSAPANITPVPEHPGLRRPRSDAVYAVQRTPFSVAPGASLVTPTSIAGSRGQSEKTVASKPRLPQTLAAWAPTAANRNQPPTGGDRSGDQQMAKPWFDPHSNEDTASSDCSDVTEIHLDGQILGHWVLDHLERALSRPPTTANFVTNHGTPTWPGQTPFV